MEMLMALFLILIGRLIAVYRPTFIIIRLATDSQTFAYYHNSDDNTTFDNNNDTNNYNNNNNKKEWEYMLLLSNCASWSTNNAQNEYKYHAIFVLQRTG